MKPNSKMIYRPTFIMLVGIPGCGKSTYAHEFLRGADVVYLSSDAIREEIFGDASCQEDHYKVFTLMQERALEALKNGYHIVYDATNITRKSRRGILSILPSYVKKDCVVVWAPIEECIARDKNRLRSVGEEVIWKMLKRFEAPFYDEGFDMITSYRGKYSDNDTEYFNTCMEALKIPHDNPHHNLGVYEHCVSCGDALMKLDLPDVVKQAGYVHDIGKPITKTFVNTRGETTDVAHYYGHQAVGAWMSYGFPHYDIILPWLISTHMAPFINQKYYNNLDPLYKSWIDALHKADTEAH